MRPLPRGPTGPQGPLARRSRAPYTPHASLPTAPLSAAQFESTDESILGRILMPVGEVQVGKLIAVLVEDAAGAAALKAMSVEAVLAELGEGGGSGSAAPKPAAAAAAAAAPAPAAAPAAAAPAASAASASSSARSPSGRVVSSPYARKVRSRLRRTQRRALLQRRPP